jgi:hypothetical protein
MSHHPLQSTKDLMTEVCRLAEEDQVLMEQSLLLAIAERLAEYEQPIFDHAYAPRGGESTLDETEHSLHY